MKTVYVDVDTQLDFLYPAGALYVPGADARVRHFIRDNSDGPGAHYGGQSSASGAAGQITRWVAANFVPQRLGGKTVYDLAR